ncbi:MAG TPA: ATP-binding protein [Polyangiaceae bacterium]|jgi:hypothetical protein|nr:ATP-binding protein [Polyangiaceae bacterium]
MWEWLERIFGQGFMPHGHCYLWSPAMIWTQVSSNLLIGVAYASIATTLAVLVRRIENIPFAWVYLAFGTFILSCGLTHFFDVVTVWHPIYWADAGVRIVTATASVATAVLIVPLVPRAVAFADAARLSNGRARQLEATHLELEKAHQLLAEREREAQRRALMSEEQFRSLVETMPQLCWISGADGKCTFRNRRWREYSGYAYDDPNAEGWRALYAPDSVEQVFGDWKKSVESKQPFELEARLRRADGEQRWFLMRAVALCDDTGSVLAWMGTCTDVHDRRLLHEDALRTAKMKDEFLATVSHELRTPLNAILGWAHLLKGGGLPPEKLARALESIERNALAQARLVDDLIDLSRIVSGKMRLDSRVIDPTEPVEGALDTVRPSASAKGIDLVSAVDREAGLVMADPGRLQQIVWNLLGNAVKFTPRNGRVSLQLKRVGRELQIVVSDSGAGIKRDFLPHLFERFSQEDGSMHRSNGGLGLGLAITKQLVELQGGEVQVESRGEGRGATFTVILPIAASAQATKEPAPSDGAPEPELRGLRLLLVEDDLDSREVVSAILADWGVNVTSARNAEEALRVLGQNQVDVIVSDVGLPGMDGHAFMRAVRQTLGLRGTPALALTAYAYLEDKKRALDAGFQMHLRKPFTHTELLSVLGELAKIAHSSSV